MKFSLVNGQRQEPQKGLKGVCPYCEQETLAKCGKIKVWHWAHKGKVACDVWWENETEWHRSWKNQFPKDWQESIHYSEDGEKHIADVKTDHGWSIEFQHSRICLQERESRELFYKRMVWVVNGSRLERDHWQLTSELNTAHVVRHNPKTKLLTTSRSLILKEWSNSKVPVFVDLQGSSSIWRISEGKYPGTLFAEEVSKADFINMHLGMSKKFQGFDDYINPKPEPPKPPKSSQQQQRRLVPRHLVRRF